MKDEEIRAMARAALDDLIGALKFQVPDHGAIQRVEDGAFVEVMLWVPYDLHR